MNCINQSQFRNAVSSRDRNCIITNYHECECDACHIIPLNICDKYQWNFQFDRRNGILMTKSLHILFDKFYWTFDIYDIQYKDGKYWCKLLIVPNHKNLTINNYKEHYVAIPLECFPFMYVHYQIFITQNYESGLDTEKLYHDIIKEDKVFHYLYRNNVPIDALLNRNFRNFLISQRIISVSDKEEYYVNAIIKSKEKSDKDYYLIWWDHLPYSESSWEPQDNLHKEVINSYESYKEEMTDTDFNI